MGQTLNLSLYINGWKFYTWQLVVLVILQTHEGFADLDKLRKNSGKKKKKKTITQCIYQDKHLDEPFRLKHGIATNHIVGNR